MKKREKERERERERERQREIEKERERERGRDAEKFNGKSTKRLTVWKLALDVGYHFVF
jgi:hypothetical protein